MKKFYLLLMGMLFLSVGQIWADDKNVNDLTVEIAPQTYTGEALQPTVVVKDGSTELTEDTHYTVEGYGANIEAGTGAGSVIIKGIEGTDTDGYTGERTVTFNISPLDLATTTASVGGTYTYDGSAKEPGSGDITITFGDNKTLAATNYQITSYGNNENATPDDQTAFVLIVPNGTNCTGEVKGYFEIGAKSLSGATLEITETKTYVYTGAEIKPPVKVEVEGKLLGEDDYTIGYGANVDAGENAKITATGKGNYKDSEDLTFTISAKSIEEGVTVDEIKNQVYKGDPVTLSETDLVIKYGSLTLVENIDFTTAYTGNEALGEATVTITAKDNYSGEIQRNFTIIDESKNIAGDKIEIRFVNVSDKVFTGEPIELTEAELIVENGNVDPAENLVKGTDYKVEYSDNVNVGESTVTIVGIGDWGGEKETTEKMKIVQADFTVEIDPIPDQKYDGTEKEPDLVVKFNGVTIDPTEYTGTYTNNKEVGEATVTIMSAGKNFKAGDTKVTKNFFITKEATPPVPPGGNIIKVAVGSGIEASHATGEYTLKKDESFELIFQLKDPKANLDDIIFNVDGKAATFTKVSDNKYSYKITKVEKAYSIEVGFKKYSLTIPKIEGATLDPAPGTYEVDFNKPFTFTLTLSDEYDESEVTVLVNGVEIEPATTKTAVYKFTIDNVLAPITIEIKGVEKDIPDSNAEVESGVKIYTNIGNLIIETTEPADVYVFTISGQVRAKRIVNGWESIALSKGLYVVKVKDEVQKIIIK